MDSEEDNGRSIQLQVFLKKKLYDLYDLYPQYGPVESTSLVKACSLMCRLYVKKKNF